MSFLLVLSCQSVVWQECSNEMQQKLERIQKYGMRLILSQPPRTPSEGLRKILRWMPLRARRDLFRMVLVHRCLRRKAPHCLSRKFMTIEEIGYVRTRGCDSRLTLDRVRTGFYRRSFSFKGAWEWNRLPRNLRELKLADVFRSCSRKQFLDVHV